jgi:UDP-glucose 4-epimerase
MTCLTTEDVAAQYVGKRVLITGASGFLGQHVVNQLATLGCHVTCVSREAHSEDRSNVEWLETDLTNRACATRTVRKAEASVIFHLAGESKGDQKIENVMDCFKNDLEATVHCLLAAHELGGCSRFVMTGSLEEPVLPQNCCGADPIPLSPYAAAKCASGFYGRMFNRVYNLPVVVLRPFMTYGPGQKKHKVVPYTILSLLRGEPPELSSGERLIDWIYVADVVDAFVRAGVAPDAAGRTLELGSQEAVPLRTVVEKIYSLVGGPRPVFGVMQDRGVRRIADSYEAFQVLNKWEPQTTLDDGLRETVEWYRQNLMRFS